MDLLLNLQKNIDYFYFDADNTTEKYVFIKKILHIY